MNPFHETILVLLGCSGLWTAATELIKWLFSRRSGIKKSIDKIMRIVREIQTEVKEEKEERKQEGADDVRRRILAFDDELRRDVPHSEEFYNQILDDIHDYENYCRSHSDYKNTKAVAAIQNIQSTYAEVKKSNQFI